ncbi:ABC transporter ATP-binding protein [Sandaracinobacter sp. RS1-74]|uniref:ABC transporter ATP-binding protein n=1 Tax=Sandaracinobacteroides sayramensis TaxID=2913411 RepID=UPI001EDAC248|nr:ABC transporter ATP-binding protein [Sandaracinobacteroides sayramensis]MCG2839843.1 ABC transporter ATP-binding protein [Sandaracinobacteroides sayramensis]
MAMPILSVRDVSRRFGGRQVVAGASFDLHPGRIACLLGPSGCGKSTLLRMIAGLESVDAGEIALQGRAVSTPAGLVPPEHRGVGLVFQDFALFPHLDVAANVGFGLAGMEPAARRERVMALLARFHVERLATAWPHMLSGGEQQRVAIARALAREPALLLLDEPFSGLDGHLRASVRQSLLADLKAAGTAVLIVTHDPEEAMMIADDLILMSSGRILQTGGAEDCYHHPVSIEAARLLGEVVILPARVEQQVAHTDFGPVPAPDMQDGPARLLLRPEDFRLDEKGTAATVVETAFGGAHHMVGLSVNGLGIAIRLTKAPPAAGTCAGFSFRPERARLFPG